MAVFIFLQFLILLALVIGGGVCVVLLYRRAQVLEDEIRRVNVSSIGDFQDVRRLTEEFGVRVDHLESTLASFQQNKSTSVNYTQRSQAIRLIRRGESAETITRTLGLPRSQVRLLMKLQEPKLDDLAKGTAHGAGS